MRTSILTALASVAITAAAISLSPASAKQQQLPCGDYDGVPSHNDCVPVSPQKQMLCQKWLDKYNATDNATKKEHYKQKYIHCAL